MITSSDILEAGILIVDDEGPNVLLLERTLRAAGYTAISATMNPHKVCELYRTRLFVDERVLLRRQQQNRTGSCRSIEAREP